MWLTAISRIPVSLHYLPRCDRDQGNFNKFVTKNFHNLMPLQLPYNALT